MPKVLFIDTKPHLYDVLKRKFELEGFDVMTQSQNTNEADLIVIGKTANVLAGPQLPNETSPNVPIIMLSDELSLEQQLASSSISHLKMPFRPSQLMAMAREVVRAA